METIEEKDKIYICTIMDRYIMDKDKSIFLCNRAVIGTIDDNNILTTKNGKKYDAIQSPEFMDSSKPYGYYNVSELTSFLDKVLYMFNDVSNENDEYERELPVTDALTVYEDEYKDKFYFVTMADNKIPVVITLDSNNLIQMARNSIQKVVGEESQDEEYEEYYNYDDDEDAFEDSITRLIASIASNEYTIDELHGLQKQIEDREDAFETVLETIDLQLEAISKGQTFSEYTRDKVDELDDNEEDEEELPFELEEDEKEEKEEKKEKIDINELYKKVTETLIAQDEPTRRVIIEIARKELDERKKKEAILLTGPTGVGKTELMRLIAKHLDRPFIKVDSTQLTVPGYSGKDIEQVLWELYLKCGRNKKKAENAIIYFDEIDKKGSSKKSDVSGQGVLNLLLQFIEGSTYDACSDLKKSTNIVKINTANMTVILGGAYNDVYKHLQEKNTMGFSGVVSSKERYRKATIKDFVEKAGMTDELMGRLAIVRLNDLDVEDIKRVMLESNESAIKIQEKIFNELGVKITFTDSYVSSVAQEAIDKKTGARGLNSIIDETTWKAFDAIYDNNDEYEEVIITEETLKDPDSFQLVKRKTKKEKE